MLNGTTEASILLIDDGELDAVAAQLDSEGKAYRRMTRAEIPTQISPPRDLLIVTPRHAERVRRGSPPDSKPGSPLRIVAVDDDSPAIRRNLRRSGFDLIVRRGAEPEIWRLLIARALYRGLERREDARVTVGSPVEVAEGDRPTTAGTSQTTLIDLSNRGCRLHTTDGLRIDQAIRFTIPLSGEEWDPHDEPLVLRGRVRRLLEEAGSPGRMAAISFDEDLPESVRTRLTSVINRWASGPSSLSVHGSEPGRLTAPPIPPCILPSLPDLMLDDETDPPVRSASEVPLELAASPVAGQNASRGEERRKQIRGQFESPVVAVGDEGRIILLGQNLSASGLRVESTDHLQRGDRVQLALHGPGPSEPLIVLAEVVRDDDERGFALAFRDLDAEAERDIAKLVDCLPDIESLDSADSGMLGAIGAILSELIRS